MFSPWPVATQAHRSPSEDSKSNPAPFRAALPTLPDCLSHGPPEDVATQATPLLAISTPPTVSEAPPDCFRYLRLSFFSLAAVTSSGKAYSADGHFD